MADSKAISDAARMLESGLLVAFPTETVYGLGGDAENPDAVAGIFALKNRPSTHPLIVHVAPEADISYWAEDVPPEAWKLKDAFWPGPLTMILKKASRIPAGAAGGQDSIGLRCPSHPVAQALLRAFKGGKGGVAAPSANRFGHVSPTAASHVKDEFGNDPRLAAVLDGGSSEVGIESTILDLSRMDSAGPVLLRPGRISAADIARVIGIYPASPDAAAPRASGTLASHYAPEIPVSLIDPEKLSGTLKALQAGRHRISLIHYSALSEEDAAIPLTSVRLECLPEIYARRLYAVLREMDHSGADIILAEKTPDTDAWRGVNDRLSRAAFNGRGIAEKWMKDAF